MDYTNCNEVPYLKLWSAVLFQVIMDLTMKTPSTEAALIKRRAEAWLASSKQDFEFLCYSSGFNPSQMLSKIKKIKSTGKACQRKASYSGERDHAILP